MDPNGKETAYGEQAQEAFRLLKMLRGGSDGDEEDDDEKKKTSKTKAGTAIAATALVGQIEFEVGGTIAIGTGATIAGAATTAVTVATVLAVGTLKLYEVTDTPIPETLGYGQVQSTYGLPSMSETNEAVFGPWNHLFGQIKGERGQTGNADGTNSPFKKLKPDPKNPDNVLEKDGHTGKVKSKIAPKGFWEWWNSKK